MYKFLTEKEINKIVSLREEGHSLPEISKIVGRGKATISRYVKDVTVLPQFADILKSKQGGSKERAKIKWSSSNKEAQERILSLNNRDKLLVLACLYWGEGNKREFNLINSDPYLIKTVIECLRELGVSKKELRFSLRVYSDMNIKEAVAFWSDILNLAPSNFSSVDVLEGKKLGKLKYGMCRVRIAKGEKHFKLIISMINWIKFQFHAAVVQWIEQDTPNV